MATQNPYHFLYGYGNPREIWYLIGGFVTGAVICAIAWYVSDLRHRKMWRQVKRFVRGRR